MRYEELSGKELDRRIGQIVEESKRTDEDFKNQKKELTKLKERAWLAVYLPMFLDEKLVPEGHTLKELWVKLAGSAMNEVEIVDDEDNVIITVPPIIKTFKDFGRLDEVSLTELGESYIEATSKGKSQMMGDVPSGVLDAVIKECTVDTTYEEGWSKLWDYYLVEGDVEDETPQPEQEKIEIKHSSELEGF